VDRLAAGALGGVRALVPGVVTLIKHVAVSLDDVSTALPEAQASG